MDVVQKTGQGLAVSTGPNKDGLLLEGRNRFHPPKRRFKYKMRKMDNVQKIYFRKNLFYVFYVKCRITLIGHGT
jgi:hypothetical protein